MSLKINTDYFPKQHYKICLNDEQKRCSVLGNGKAVLLQAWTGPEGSTELRYPDFMTMAQDGGKVVSLSHRPPLPLGDIPSTHFC